MRTLRQPGPVHPVRVDVCRGEVHQLHYVVPAGTPLNDGMVAQLVAAGFQSATIVLRDARLCPFRFVMPGPPDGPAHVAYFTAPVQLAGVTRIDHASATFGWIDGQPRVHIHAAWTEVDGRRRGGHILPLETVVTEPFEAEAWGFKEIRAASSFDEETGFPLFQPSGGGSGSAIFARVKPNEDIVAAIEGIGVKDAAVFGMGSLIGAAFSDGRVVPGNATEVLVRQGRIRGGIAKIELLVVDGEGSVHQGWLQRGENPVCITFDVVLIPDT